MTHAPRFATTTDGACIRFDVFGSGPPLVFVHGLGDDRHLWRGIIEKLENEFTCVALDLRGHGESSGGDGFDPFALHRDVTAVIAAAGVVAPLLIGHSLGGMAVTTTAARSATRGIINVDQPLELSGLATRVRSLGSDLHTRAPADVFFAVLGEAGIGPLDAGAVERLHGTRQKLSRRVLLETWKPLFDDAETLLGTVARHVSGIRAPYLSLHGTDPGSGYGVLLSRWVPGASVEVWPDHGHFLHLIDERRFVGRVLNFWQSSERNMS